MITVTEAKTIIDQKVGPLVPESVALADAHGRILREAITAPEDLPPFDRSSMDGYAVRQDDPAEEFTVCGEIRAGQSIDRELQPGEAMRIFTGARLPSGNLRVIIQEHVAVTESGIRVVKRSSASNVRLKGEDARAGEVLLESSTRLDATALALLASMGKTTIGVSRQPRVFHLTTGDEIASPEEEPKSGQIRNSNAVLIAALCREHGAGRYIHRHAPDDLPAMIDLLTQAGPENFDLILISGGSGPGAYDFSAKLFEHLQATIHFREVNVRPGKPLIFGTTERQVIFGLPGNALSHDVCFQLFVRRAMERLLNHPVAVTHSAFLIEPLPDALNARETWWPVQVITREGQLECRPLPWKSSGDLTRLPTANGLIKIAPATAQLAGGTIVELLLTRQLI